MDKNNSEVIDARSDWEGRIGQRIDGGEDSRDGTARHDNVYSVSALPAPQHVTAESGAGQVTISWQLVPGAVGYLVQRADTAAGPFVTIDHGGDDVLITPGPRYADTTGVPGTTYWYVVRALADPRYPAGEPSQPVTGTSLMAAAQPLQVRVQAQRSAGRLERVWHMLGSEHLSQMFYGEGPGGSVIGTEFEQALRNVQSELGATHIRAHAIFHDENHVYSEVDGLPHYDFTQVDRIYDRLLALQLRPIVELSFMPRELAQDTQPSVFTYQGLISQPKDWERWAQLCQHFVAHLIERYGLDEVKQWGFEVWNEPNLQVFWRGTKEDYFYLYAVTARAIKQVNRQLLVGGPATAAAEWIADFLQYVRAQHLPLDFISTHTYGNLPLDFTQALQAYGFTDVKIWWTEWGVTPTHFKPVNDTVFSAAFTLHGMKSVQGRVGALAYWVLTDHFEELGRAPRLFHGGFGLQTIGNLRKPRYWALVLAEELGSDLLSFSLEGDGAYSLLDGWAARKDDGTVDLLFWNGTLDQSKIDGCELLQRRLQILLTDLPAQKYAVSLTRVDSLHSNIVQHWHSDADWPDSAQWAELHAADKLDVEQLPDLLVKDGEATLALDLPMPGIARLRLTPQ